MTLEQEVQENIARLLALVCNDQTDPESYEFVLKKLTRMSILGTMPVGCHSKPTSWSHKTDDDADDFSAAKESFIAP